MDHSLKGYLRRRSTHQLLDLWYSYQGAREDVDLKVLRIICEILLERGEDIPLVEEIPT